MDNKRLQNADPSTTRRSFLGTSFGLLTAVGGASGVSTARSEKSSGRRNLPVEAEGQRKYKIRPDGEEYIFEQKFISPDLKEAFDHPIVEYDPIRVPEEDAPQSWTSQNGTITRNHKDTSVFGTFEQHANAEKNIREQVESSSGQISTQASDPTYYGPVYQYTSASLEERKAPINVAWSRSLSLSATDVKSKMNDLVNGWGSLVTPSGDRYIQVWNGSSQEPHVQDKHAKRQDGAFSQYHVRLWDIPHSSSVDYRVVGSAHYDPEDHVQAREDFDDWKYNESRGEVLKAWDDRLGESTSLQDYDNGSGFPGDHQADGEVGVVY